MGAQNPTPADIDLVVRLHMMTEGLPGGMRTKYFRNVHVDVHNLANGLILRGEDYDTALRQATQVHLPHPNRTNLKLFWLERRNLVRYFRQALVMGITSTVRSLTQRYKVMTGKRQLSRGPAETILGFEQLQAELIERHPDVIFYWSSLTELGPSCTYLGCTKADGRTLHVIAQRVHSDVDPSPQTRLAQLGEIIEALTHRQSIGAYEAVTDSSTNQLRFEEVHTQSIYWNQHEALITRHGTVPDALIAEFEMLCRGWWKDQGRPTPLVIEVGDEDYAADMRAMMPTTAMWNEFGVSPVEGTPYVERTADEFRVFDHVFFRQPYIAPALLTMIFIFALLPVATTATLILAVLVLILALSLSFPASLFPVFVVSVFLLLFTATFIAAALATRLVSAITLRTSLTTPYHRRERVYVS